MNTTVEPVSFTRATWLRSHLAKIQIPARINFGLPMALILLATSRSLTAAEAPIQLLTGWSVLKEGTAEGTAVIDAAHPTNPDPHLLKIAITKFPAFGQGRLGLKNSTPIAVKEGQSYDITFKGISEGIGVGLVFTLEADDGKVLGRTTLPEIGRGGGGGRGNRGGRGAAPATDTTNAAAPTAVRPPPWREYLLSVKARASASNAHLTVTAIEPVPVWIDGLSIAERQPSN